MDKPMIGIRQADGSFYEILGDAQSGHKRLVLSAARSDQRGVRIDLFRSTDGTADPAGALGSISLDDPQGLGYDDIEFRVDVDAEGLLEASAALPGQPPRTLKVDLTPFRSNDEAFPSLDPPLMDFDDLGTEPMTLDLPDDEPLEAEPPKRSDADILGDEAFAGAELDTLDDGFGLDEPLEMEEDEPRRSDADILGDESIDTTDIDTLDDFSFEDPDGGTPETRGLDTLDSLDSLDAPNEAPTFDLGDLDAGFGDEPAPAPAAVNPAEDWEKISLDDMEPMEFLDTGAEISAPSAKASSRSSSGDDSFRMDDDEPLELGDFDSDMSDLPDLGDLSDASPSAPPSQAGSDADFDEDFLPPPSLTESSPWDADEPVAQLDSHDSAAASKPSKASKTKAPAKPKAERAARASSGDGLDKMALFLSLAALSLLVLLILVLLFLNMIKAPQAPVIQPEVQRWKEPTSLVASPRQQEAIVIDLGSPQSRTFEAETILQVPQELKAARVHLALGDGDTVADATRRFGAPARVQGDQLSW